MINALWSGLAIGAIYALIALGYNIIFIAAGTFNFAQASLVMLSVFLAHWGLSDRGLPVLLVVLLSVAATTAVAVLVERVAIRPSSDANVHLITTIGAATILAGAAELVWGSDPLSVPTFLPDRNLHLFGGVITTAELGLLVVAVALSALFELLSRRSMVGMAAVAVSEDREAAISRGINARLYSLGGFAAAGAIAGLVGVVVGPETLAFPALGAALALKGFVAMALGGYGSIGGGLLGGFVVGVVESEAGYLWGSSYRGLVVFVILLMTLILKPSGLFGARRARVV